MKKKNIIIVMFIIIAPLFCQANEGDKYNFNYKLIGDNENIQIEIDLNTFQFDYYKFLINKEDFTSELTDDGYNAMMQISFNALEIKITNKRDNSIQLNKYLDSIILSNGETQIEYNKGEILSVYPNKILRNSSQTIIYSSPYDVLTSLSGALGTEPFIIPMAITQIDAAMNSLLFNNVKNNNSTITEEAKKIKYQELNEKLKNNYLFGEIELGVEQIIIPLYLEISDLE